MHARHRNPLMSMLGSQAPVGPLQVSAPELVSGMSGESEAKLRGLFLEARQLAPSILFIGASRVFQKMLKPYTCSHLAIYAASSMCSTLRMQPASYAASSMCSQLEVQSQTLPPPDEIDAIFPKRDTAQREMERRIVAQMLTCMDDLAVRRYCIDP
jgi:SpoVK/Ycf46/Vps4 family AAA+-type ATPase